MTTATVSDFLSLQAIAAHGGVRQVAKLMGWRVVGKNSSPWYDLRSTREVFDAFAEAEGLPKQLLPNLEMLQRVGRKDMIKGAEEWGGLEELAELLEYKVCCKSFLLQLQLLSVLSSPLRQQDSFAAIFRIFSTTNLIGHDVLC